MVKIVEITTPTCGVCKMIAPMVDKVVSMFSSDELEFTKLCYGEDDEAGKYAEQYGITNVPVFFFYKDGEMVRRHDGAVSLPQLKSIINELK